MLSSHFREDRPILSTSGMADGNDALAAEVAHCTQRQEQQQQLELGTEVEVLSVSSGLWFLGKVVSPKHPGKVTIEYMGPGECLCRKHLCCGSEDVRVVPKIASSRTMTAENLVVVFSVTEHSWLIDHVFDPTGTGKNGVVGRKSVSFASPNARTLSLEGGGCDGYKIEAKMKAFSVIKHDHVVDPTGTGKFPNGFEFDDGLVGRNSVLFASPDVRTLLQEVDPAGMADVIEWMESWSNALTEVTHGVVANMCGDAGCCGVEWGQRGCVDGPCGSGLKMNQMECTPALASGCALATGTAIGVAGLCVCGPHALPCAVVAGGLQMADSNCCFPPPNHEFQYHGRRYDTA